MLSCLLFRAVSVSNVHEVDAEIRDEGSGKPLCENPAGAQGPVSRRNNMALRGKNPFVNCCSECVQDNAMYLCWK